MGVVASSDHPGAGCRRRMPSVRPPGAPGEGGGRADLVRRPGALSAGSTRSAPAAALMPGGNPSSGFGTEAGLAGAARRPRQHRSVHDCLAHAASCPTRRTARRPEPAPGLAEPPQLSPTLQKLSDASRTAFKYGNRYGMIAVHRAGLAAWLGNPPDGLAMPGDTDRTQVRPAAPHATRLPSHRRRGLGAGRLWPVHALVPQPPRRPARDAAPPRPPPDRGAGNGGPRSQRPRPDHPRPGPLDGAPRDADRLPCPRPRPTSGSSSADRSCPWCRIAPRGRVGTPRRAR